LHNDLPKHTLGCSGVLLKDLIALHAAYPDRVGDEQINVRKMMMIGGIFQVSLLGACLICET